MNHWSKVVLLGLLVGLAPLQAEQVYLRNRIFHGPVSGSGKSTWVGMKAFAEAMGLKVTQQGLTTILHPSDLSSVTDFGVSEEGGVFVVGVKVESRPGPGGELMIPLVASAEAAGCRVQLNPSLGTIDVNLIPLKPPVAVEATPAASESPASEEPAKEEPPKEETARVRKPVKRGVVPGKADDLGLRAVMTPLPPQKINRPGEAVEIREHLVKGRYTLVVFGAPW